MGLLLIACAPDIDPLATMSAGVSYSGGPGGGPGGSNGDPTDGPTGGTTSDTGGTTSGDPDHGLCDAYLACVAAAVPDTLPANEANFGPNGACWDGLPETIEQCLATCAEGLESFGMLYPDEPACQGGGGSGTTGTTGPSCEPAPNGSDCGPQDACGCESGKCRPQDEFGGVCSECIDDSDCAEGLCVLSSNGSGAVCRADGPGEQCLDESCIDPSTPYCVESHGYSTCSECRTDDDCGGQDLCTPVYDEAFEGYGTYFCHAPGSVPLHGGCPVQGYNVDAVCATGLCALVTVNGRNFGACSECSIDAHCPPGQQCAFGDFDYRLKQLTGRVCQ